MPIKCTGEKTLTVHQQNGTIEVRIPIRWIKAKGQRRIHSRTAITKPIVDETLRTHLVKAHRWERKLLKGEATSIQELARMEKVDKSDLSKILRLTTLAPEIQADILLRRGKWPLSWVKVKNWFALEWGEQAKHFVLKQER